GRVQLDLPRAVDEVQERRPPLPAAGVDAAGDAHTVAGLLAGRQGLVWRLDVGDRRDAGERVRERVDARRPQPLELPAAGGEEFRSLLALDAHTVILVTVSSRVLPLGSWTFAVSPFLRPTSALPTGDSLDSLLADGSASVEPTIV